MKGRARNAVIAFLVSIISTLKLCFGRSDNNIENTYYNIIQKKDNEEVEAAFKSSRITRFNIFCRVVDMSQNSDV